MFYSLLILHFLSDITDPNNDLEKLLHVKAQKGTLITKLGLRRRMHRIGQDREDWSAPVTQEMGDKPVEEEEDENLALFV